MLLMFELWRKNVNVWYGGNIVHQNSWLFVY
jgi:hypothetical protein